QFHGRFRYRVGREFHIHRIKGLPLSEVFLLFCLGRLLFHLLFPDSKRLCCRRWTRHQRAQQREGCPIAHSLAWLAELRVLHSLSCKSQDICEKLVVLSGELIGVLDWIAFRKMHLSRPSGKYIASCPLNEMASKNAPLLLAQLLHVDIFEAVIQQTQQGTEATLDPAVRRRREQQNVS